MKKSQSQPYRRRSAAGRAVPLFFAGAVINQAVTGDRPFKVKPTVCYTVVPHMRAGVAIRVTAVTATVTVGNAANAVSWKTREMLAADKTTAKGVGDSSVKIALTKPKIFRFRKPNVLQGKNTGTHLVEMEVIYGVVIAKL